MPRPDHRRGTKRARRRAVWLAVFALLLQTLVPVLHHPASMALDGMVSASDANLCHAAGNLPASPDEPGKAPHHHLPVCAICQAVHAIGGFSPPPAPCVTAVGEIVGGALAMMPMRFAPQQTGGIAQPRGPPASI